MAPPKLKEKSVRVTRTQAAPRKSDPSAKRAAPLKRHYPIQPSTPPPKQKSQKQSKITKRQKKVTFSPLPSPKAQRRRHKLKPSEHPLSLEFAEAATTYRATFISSTLSALSNTHADLQNHLNSITSHHVSTLLAHEEKFQRQGLLIPLADDRLEVTTTINGVRTKTQHALGESMTAFAATVSTEEKNLRELWKQWGSVQQSIVTLGEEVLGSSGRSVGNAGEGSAGAEELGATSSGYKRELEELEFELKKKVERVLEEVGYQGETMVEQLVTEEAADKARARNQKQAIVMFMQS